MPPPTQIMAAVPTALSNVRKTGMPRTMPRPSARLIPPKAEAPSFFASARPTSSAFTISATTPYTATVIPIADHRQHQ